MKTVSHVNDFFKTSQAIRNIFKFLPKTQTFEKTHFIAKLTINQSRLIAKRTLKDSHMIKFKQGKTHRIFATLVSLPHREIPLLQNESVFIFRSGATKQNEKHPPFKKNLAG